MHYDVAVVGGSSTGLIAARETAKRGLRTAVFEEDPVIGRPEKCAGLYSIQGLRLLEIPVDGPYLQNKIRGAVFVSPFGKRFEVDFGKFVAAVLNRERLDLFLAEQAVKDGADIFIDDRVTSAVTNGTTATVKTSKHIVTANYVIDAEGRAATVAKQLFPDYRCGKWLPIVQLQATNHGYDPDFVYLFFRKYLTDYFGYLVPVDDQTGKVGVAASKHPELYVRKILEEFFPKAKITGFSSSSIYVGWPLKKVRNQNALLVGDVAGQVKATTGGGVITGGLASVAAAKHIAGEGLYESLLRPLEAELQGMYRIRQLYEKLSPKQIHLIISSMQDSYFSNVLKRVGDMDRQSTTAFKALLSPAIFKTAATALKHFIKSHAYV
ncbi:MAG: hypothetical protein QXY84_06575 [Candidatus Caldarchaeum sp.]